MNQIWEFSSCVLDLGPKEAAHLRGSVGSGVHMGPSVPMRRESPTITLLSVLAEAVWRRRVYCLALGTVLGKASWASSLTSPSIYSASPTMPSWDCLAVLPASQDPALCPTVTGHGVHPPLSGGCLPGAFLSGMPGNYSTSQSLALAP